jgi:hypothetical protein
VECLFKVGNEGTPLSRFYDDVINIDLQVAPYLPFEIELHTSLVCSPHVLQSEQHFYVAETAERGDQCGGGLVRLGEGIW